MIQKNHINIFKQQYLTFCLSVFYGFLSLGITDSFYLLFHGLHVSINEALFVFTAIVSFYFYQKEIAPVIHHAVIKSLRPYQKFILILFASSSCLTFTQLDFDTQLLICFFSIIGISYHNHTRYFLFRKLILWKNIIISLSWTGICLLSFNIEQFRNLGFWLTAFCFFLIVFIQSILFDYIDIKKDKPYNHHTFASNSDSKNLFQIIRYLCLSIVGILCVLTFYGNISLLGFLLNISLLSVYYSNLYNYIKSQQAHLIYFTDIIFLLFSLSFHL